MTTKTFTCAGCDKPLRPEEVWARVDWSCDAGELQGLICRACLAHPVVRDDFASADRGTHHDLRKGKDIGMAVLVTAEVHPDWTVAQIARHVRRSDEFVRSCFTSDTVDERDGWTPGHRMMFRLLTM